MQKVHAIVLGMLLCGAASASAQEILFPPVQGWTMSVESRVYDANDLWDIINGAADLYLEYAFVDLHIARYKTGSNREVKVELYRHRDAENAFGIYSAERSPEYNFIPIGSQGYQQTSVLNFVGGECYLRLSSYQSDSASRSDLQTIGHAVERQLNRSVWLPQTLHFFPPTGKQANSEQFVAQNFLGYSFLRSVYTAVYGGSVSCKAFIINHQSKDDAAATMKEYFSKVPHEKVTTQGDDGFDIQDPNNGRVSIAQQGTYLYGVVDCTDERARAGIMAGVKQNLSHP